jgi:hypothetical protein
LFQLHYVWMFEFLQKHYLSVGSLRVGGILKGIEVFLEGIGASSSSVGDFPHDAVSTAAYFLYYFEPFSDVWLDFLVVSHIVINNY